MQNNNELILMLNSTEKLIFQSDEPLEEAHCCTEVPLFLVSEVEKTLISNDSIKENMHVLKVLLTKALEGELILHSSIDKSIGLLWNEELEGKPGLVYTKFQGIDDWVGNSHSLWCHNLASWLYNDADGSIIFEITPIYRRAFSNSQKKISYKKWISSYEPHLKRKISQDLAKKWLETAENILASIQKNMNVIFNLQN